MKPPSLADARSDLVRRRALEGAAALLGRGEALTFAAVAAEAGVPERTLYRHFPAREALLGALYDWVNERVSVEAQRPTDGEGLARLVRQVFPGFDALAPVVRELLATPEGRLARLSANPARQRAALAIVQKEAPELDRISSRRVAAVLQLLTAAGTWQALHDYWGMDGAEAAEASALASELILEGARSKKWTARGGARKSRARRQSASSSEAKS